MNIGAFALGAVIGIGIWATVLYALDRFGKRR